MTEICAKTSKLLLLAIHALVVLSCEQGLHEVGSSASVSTEGGGLPSTEPSADSHGFSHQLSSAEATQLEELAQVYEEGGVYQDRTGALRVVIVEPDQRAVFAIAPDGTLRDYTIYMTDDSLKSFRFGYMGAITSFSSREWVGNVVREEFFSDDDGDGIFERQDVEVKDSSMGLLKEWKIRFTENPSSGEWKSSVNYREQDISEPCFSFNDLVMHMPIPVASSTPTDWAPAESSAILPKDRHRHLAGPRLKRGWGGWHVPPTSLERLVGRIYAITDSETPGLACTTHEVTAIRTALLLSTSAIQTTIWRSNKKLFEKLARLFDYTVNQPEVYVACLGEATPGSKPPVPVAYKGLYSPNRKFTVNGVFWPDANTTGNVIDLNFHLFNDSAFSTEYSLRETVVHELLHAVNLADLPAHSDPPNAFDSVYSCTRAVFCAGYNMYVREDQFDETMAHRSVTRDAFACADESSFRGRILTNFDVQVGGQQDNCECMHKDEPRPDLCRGQKFSYCNESTPLFANASSFVFDGRIPQAVSRQWGGTEVPSFEHPGLREGVCVPPAAGGRLGDFFWMKMKKSNTRLDAPYIQMFPCR